MPRSLTHDTASGAPRAGGRLLRRILVVAFGAVLLLAVALTVPVFFGYNRYLITGGSMEPTIHKGAIVYATPVKENALRQGDIVTFRTPPEYGSRAVTHRIVKVVRDQRGVRVFTTRGDANKSDDPWENITFNDDAAARYGFNVPYVGWFLSLTMAPSYSVNRLSTVAASTTNSKR
jgi:signal peptidase I